ncbi:hypothetical protein [Halorussus salinisoli]|uniref:hypothetical protein n=1 Tax=Halorussus salinisoli TaxID=2558242 RepID=UPI0010C1EBA1|nr:hypothetical protein [Halorussus salinisoli]
MVELPSNFWPVLCEFEHLWYFMFVLDIVLLVLLGVSALLVDPGSASFYIVVLSAIVGVPLAIVLGLLLRLCAT